MYSKVYHSGIPKITPTITVKPVTAPASGNDEDTPRAPLVPVASGSGWVATVVLTSYGVCGGGEDACGTAWSPFVPFVQASVGWSFATVTLGTAGAGLVSESLVDALASRWVGGHSREGCDGEEGVAVDVRRLVERELCHVRT